MHRINLSGFLMSVYVVVLFKFAGLAAIMGLNDIRIGSNEQPSLMDDKTEVVPAEQKQQDE